MSGVECEGDGGPLGVELTAEELVYVDGALVVLVELLEEVDDARGRAVERLGWGRGGGAAAAGVAGSNAAVNAAELSFILTRGQ